VRATAAGCLIGRREQAQAGKGLERSVDVGLVGLPVSGKTSVLELLAGNASGRVAVARVPDLRLGVLAAMFRPKKVTPATIRLTELPGVPYGRLEQGERNAFFEGVRRADAILHVVRAFEDPAVPHPAGSVDPLRDARAVEEELLLADLERVEGIAARLEKNRARGREGDLQLEALRACAAGLEEGRPVRVLGLPAEAVQALSGFGLLTASQELLALNLDEEGLRAGAAMPELHEWSAAQAITVVPFSAKVEREIASLPDEERPDFLAAYGLKEAGAERLARAAYAALGLISFLTAGEDEVRAWPIRAGTTARRAAGKIHSDIERGFIRAEVAAFGDLVRVGDWKALREQGLLRLEGQDYVVRDGDIVHFRFHV
jgi:GTP-binding protein YchF